MLGLTHLLRLRIACEQFSRFPRIGRWLARFFTFRNACCYASRFRERPAVLRRCLAFGRVPLARLPSGWVWQGLKLASLEGRLDLEAGRDAGHARQFGGSPSASTPAAIG